MTQFLLVRSKQGLGWDRVCEAQRSNESPSGAFKRQRGLRQQMEGRCPNEITSEMQTHCRSEVPDGQKIFKVRQDGFAKLFMNQILSLYYREETM